MEQDRATPDFHYPVFLWASSKNRHKPTLVSCSSSISLYRQAATFFPPLAELVFLACFLQSRAWARAAAGRMGALPLLAHQVPCALEQLSLCHKTLHKSYTARVKSTYYVILSFTSNQDSQSKLCSNFVQNLQTVQHTGTKNAQITHILTVLEQQTKAL